MIDYTNAIRLPVMVNIIIGFRRVYQRVRAYNMKNMVERVHYPTLYP